MRKGNDMNYFFCIIQIFFLYFFSVLSANGEDGMEQNILLTKENIKIQAHMKQKIYRPDEKIILIITLENNSSTKIIFTDTNIMQNFSWRIMNRKTKQPIELTHIGQDLLETSFFRRIILSIQPQTSYTYSITMNDFFIFNRKAVYDITVSGSFLKNQKKVEYKIEGLSVEVK